MSGTSLRRPAVHKFEKNGTDNGTWNAKASCGVAASERPRIECLLRMREKTTRAFEDLRATNVTGRSIRKRLERSSSIASAAIVASTTVEKRQALSRPQREHHNPGKNNIVGPSPSKQP